MTANTHHGKMSSAKRDGGRKPKLSDRDSRALKRIVSKNHRTTKVQGTVVLYIHLEDPVSTYGPTRASQIQHPRYSSNAKPRITEINADRRGTWSDDLKTWTSDYWKFVT